MWGTPDMVSKLEHVLVRTPTTIGNFVADAQWREPDRNSLVREHNEFVQLLEKLGCKVHIAEAVDGLVDAVYMHDPMIMTPPNQLKFAKTSSASVYLFWVNSQARQLLMVATKFGSMRKLY